MKSINDLVKHKKKIMKNFRSELFDILMIMDNWIPEKGKEKKEIKQTISKIIP